MIPVIAIAGPPGSGKTALIDALSRLTPSSALFLDGFETPSDLMSPAALAAWLKAGARFDHFTVAGLAEALAALKSGVPVREPVSGRAVSPAPLILFEMPFGRAHPPTAPLIDLLVWLDTPLDAALARNVLAWQAQGRPGAWLAAYMKEYLAVTRAVLAAQKAQIAPAADLTLDGLAPPADAARKLLEYLQSRRLLQTGNG
jgi:uridine kinase